MNGNRSGLVPFLISIITIHCLITNCKKNIMLTLIISTAFKGTKFQFAKAIIICLFIDAFVVLCCLPSCSNAPALSSCPYEGAECPNAQSVMQDYQLEYYMDTLWVYDGSRLVGKHINTDTTSYTHGSFIDSLIMADNL